jgi:DNA-binding CsgD family transcriptional regulator
MNKINNGSALALASLRNAKTKEEINEILASLASIIGAKNFQFIPAPNCPLNEENKLLEFGNYAFAQKQIYENEQSAIVDPCRHIALAQTQIVRWRRVFQTAKGKKERDFIGQLREAGIKDGISLPVHGPCGAIAILCFASNNFLDINPEDEEFLQLVAILSLQRIKQYFAKKSINNGKAPTLTEREIECLGFVLEGKTNWEISVLMGISPRTVQFHIANCQSKLGANNRIQAAVRALIHGIIAPPKDFVLNDDFDTKGFSPQAINFELDSTYGQQIY